LHHLGTPPVLAVKDRDEGIYLLSRISAEAACLIDRPLGPAADVALFASIIDVSLQVENLRDHDWAAVICWAAVYGKVDRDDRGGSRFRAEDHCLQTTCGFEISRRHEVGVDA